MKALVIGLGQDGQLMCELLLASGIDFRAVIRRSFNSVTFTKQTGIPAEYVVSRSIISAEALSNLYREFPFTHIFNFAANSFVQDSNDYFHDYIFSNSSITWELLKLIKQHPDVWLMQPLSCEILSKTPVNETDVACCIAPRNAYGLSKLVDLHSCAIERASSDLNILSPIIYNHESRLRPSQFFTRKVVNYLRAEVKKPTELHIFNTTSVRDWGSAPEYISILLDAASRGLVGSPLLGTGYGLTVEAFIDHALAACEIVVEKSVENSLLRWEGDNLLIVESNRDTADAARVVVANRIMVSKFFGRAPEVFGTELVQQLVQNVI